MYIKQKDIVGHVFSRLTVLELSSYRRYTYRTVLCQCECGNKCIVDTHSLNKGDVKSCGCLKQERDKFANYKTSTGESLSSCYNNMKKGALRRNHSFNITKEECWDLINRPCMYCGYKDSSIGIDRIDNKIGYEIENCAPCCKTCNFMKRSLSVDQFIEHCKRIAKHNTLEEDI